MFLRSTLLQNAFALFGVQICRKVIPLATVPYLARTLGVAAWGKVAFALALGNLIALLVEFGFHLSATRSIARNRESLIECSDVIAGVVGVQTVLFLIGSLIALILLPWLTHLQSDASFVLAGLAFAWAQGFTPIWFFQGMEWIRLGAALEFAGKIAGVACIFLFVHSPADASKAVLMQALAPGLSTVAGIWLMYRKVPFRMPCRLSMKAAIRNGWPMFIFRGGTSLYGAANVLLLGVLASAEYVSYFAAAEKIYTAVFGLLTPVQDALYPRLSHMIHRSADSAARLASMGALANLVWAVTLAAGLFTTAPLVIRLLMGPGFEGAVLPLRILACMLPAAAMMVSAGLQWLIPLGKDREVNQTVLGAGVINIVIALILVPRLAHVGMALSVAITETLVGFAMVWLVSQSVPFWKRSHHKGLARTAGRNAVELAAGQAADV